MFRKFLVFVVLGALVACGDGSSGESSPKTENNSDVASSSSQSALEAHSEQFERRIEQVTDNVWIAIGYGLANSILIEGDDGLIVIDTMETIESGNTVAQEFRQLSDKPLRAIIYTHNHADHVFGAQAFVDVLGDAAVAIEIYSHQKTQYYVNRVISEIRPILSARSFRMFGVALDEEKQNNDGIGLSLLINENSRFGFIPPTTVFDKELKVSVAGIELELVHAPGETDDQIFVWLPQYKMLALGDNLYKAFPNLYTIRGTPYRSLKQWADSLDRMRELPVAMILPSHTGVVRGEELAMKTLTDYRDAIRFVHDQTIRLMNLGLTPDEVVTRLELPPHLRESDYLQEFYGTVEWSSRSVFSGNLGWFDGNPSSLQPLAPIERAQYWQQLVGGLDSMIAGMEDALENQQYQWVLELTDQILRLEPSQVSALEARIKSLKALAKQSTNPNARQYYFSSALELEDGVRFKPLSTSSDTLISSIPMRSVFDALAVSLHAEDTLDTHLTAVISLPDLGQDWSLIIRRGVLEYKPGVISEPDIHASVDSLVLKKLLGGQLNAKLALVRDFAYDRGGVLAMGEFLGYFKALREAPEPSPFATIDLD